MIPTLGCCYYPEHWPEAIWAEDAARMKAAGLTWVRIGEFAWSRIEPKEGQFDWAWLDRAVDILGAAGLKVVMGTPTATPPRWVVTKHPDMLAVDADGRTRGFGSRRHYCFSHEGYRAEAARITEAMAKRYGPNPHVAAWQTDNEYGCHDTTLSYSDAARRAFRDWLGQKYQSPDALNRAWGNVFWSMQYDSFDEIDLPNLTVTEPNPAHVMDFRRFSSDQVAAFNRSQAEILRRYTEAPLTHNYMGRITDFDHFAVGADLDFASWDSYPLGFLEDRSWDGEEWKARFARHGDPDFQAFHHDLYRAVGRGRWWVMEQQPGPVNWAPYNPTPADGMVRLWSWEAIAHGAEAVVYFRWRQVPFAQEQMHAGLLRPDSAPSRGLIEAEEVAKEIAGLGNVAQQIAPVGLVFDYASAWSSEVQPQGRDYDYFQLVFETYRALRRLGLTVDILPPDTADFGARKMVVIPGLFAWTAALRRAVESFDGLVVAGPRTGAKTEDFHTPVPLPPQMPGVAATVSRVASLRPNLRVPLPNGGKIIRWREEVDTDTAIETGDDGWPVLMGSDKRFYLAGWLDGAAAHRIFGDLAQKAGLAVTDLGDAKRRRDTATHRFLFDYEAASVEIIPHD
ncbi:beta-galactosidase [Paracoccaceae bacterium GXU_MW_L88]